MDYPLVSTVRRHGGLRYEALAGEREFDVQIISHLTEMDSTHGEDMHTLDEH